MRNMDEVTTECQFVPERKRFTGDLIKDLGDRLDLDVDLSRRRIRSIPWTLLVGVLAVLFIWLGSLADVDGNSFIHEFTTAFGCFLLGFFVSPIDKLREWTKTVNEIMKLSHGSMNIAQAIIASLDDDCKIITPMGYRLDATRFRRSYIRFRYPRLARRWEHYYRRGMACLQPCPLPVVNIDPVKVSQPLRHPWLAVCNLWNCNYEWRRQRLLFRVCQYIYELDPFPPTLEYLKQYTNSYMSQKYVDLLSAKDDHLH